MNFILGVRQKGDLRQIIALVGVVRQGSFFCVMSSNPKFSRFLLESANEAMDALVDGASEYYKSFIVLKRLHDDKGLPVDGQRMQEMSDLIQSLRKMLYDERASLQSKLATFEDEEAAEEYIAELKQKAEAGRTPQE